MINRARNSEETDPARTAMAETLVPGVASVCDQCGQGEALDVLDQSRPTPYTAFERARRCPGWPGIARVDEAYRGRFLARYVIGGRSDDAGAAPDVVRTFSKGVPERGVRRSVLLTDIEDDVVRPNRARGEQRTVDHQVRTCGHQRSVF